MPARYPSPTQLMTFCVSLFKYVDGRVLRAARKTLGQVCGRAYGKRTAENGTLEVVCARGLRLTGKAALIDAPKDCNEVFLNYILLQVRYTNHNIPLECSGRVTPYSEVIPVPKSPSRKFALPWCAPPVAPAVARHRPKGSKTERPNSKQPPRQVPRSGIPAHHISGAGPIHGRAIEGHCNCCRMPRPSVRVAFESSSVIRSDKAGAFSSNPVSGIVSE